MKISFKTSFEFSDGIKQSLLRTLGSIGPKGFLKGPKERSRLVFLLSWIHCVIIERLRYTPTGWTKRYEFSEGDLISSISTLDAILDSLDSGENISLDKIPFDRIGTIVANNIYGGKIDNEFDQLILRSIIDEFFGVHSFNQNSRIIHC